MNALLSVSLMLLCTPPDGGQPRTTDSAQLSPDMTPSALVAQLATCEALATCGPARALLQRGQKASDALIQGLTHPEELVRFWSCGVLSELRPKMAFEALLDRFQNDDKLRVRNAALYALGSLKDARAIAPLSAAMRKKDPNIRIAGMMGLSLLRDASTAPLIQRALSDRDEEVRAMAIHTLGDMRIQGAFDAIALRLKEDIKPVVRAAACVSLVQLTSDKTVSILSAAVQSDANIQVRAECAMALGRYGDPAALGPLKRVVAEPEPLSGAAKWAIQTITHRKKRAPQAK